MYLTLQVVMHIASYEVTEGRMDDVVLPTWNLIWNDQDWAGHINKKIEADFMFNSSCRQNRDDIIILILFLLLLTYNTFKQLVWPYA